MRTLNYKFSGKFNRVQTKTCVGRQASLVDEFYQVNGVSEDDGNKCVHFSDPIYVLFNQERLNMLGNDTAQKYIESLMENFKSNSLAELRKQCSDEDLLATIKSRHLQSPSEILAWTRYMSQNMKEFENAIKEAKQEVETKVESPTLEEAK